MTPPTDAREWKALARKYRALGALRTARDADGGGGGDADDARALREKLAALAREFPGCLRELDTLGAEELARRAEVADAAVRGTPEERWMAWISAYHRLMRATLAIKPAMAQDKGKRKTTDDETLAALARQVSEASEVPVDAAFVRAVGAPPEGRLGILVMRALAAHFHTTALEIAATLFPPRRPRPYQL